MVRKDSKVELRADFDQLQNLYNHVKIETDLIRANYQELIVNCKELIEKTTEILSERDYYYSEWQYAKDILTPRYRKRKIFFCSSILPSDPIGINVRI